MTSPLGASPHEQALSAAARLHDHWAGEGTIGTANAHRNTREVVAAYLTALPAPDLDEWENLVERALFLASGQDDPHSVTIAELCDALRSLSAKLAEAERERDEARARADAAEFAARNGRSMAEDALHAIRELLTEAGVPAAAFIDDHVGNAIAQRNAAESELTTLRAKVAELEPALRDIAESDDIENPLDPARNKRIAQAVTSREENPHVD